MEEPGEFSVRFFFLTKIASTHSSIFLFSMVRQKKLWTWIHAYLAPAGTHDKTFLIKLCGKKKNQRVCYTNYPSLVIC